MIKQRIYHQLRFIVLIQCFLVFFLNKANSQLFTNPLFPNNIKNIPIDTSEMKNISINELISFFVEKRKNPSYRVYSEKDKRTIVGSIINPIAYFNEEIQKSLSEEQPIAAYLEPDRRINNLFFRIDKLNKITVYETSNIEFKKLLNDIYNLPPSKEKILLLIKLSEKSLNNRNFYEETEVTYYKVKQIAESLSDTYEKAIAWLYIGNYLLFNQNSIDAISAYYLGREYIYNSKKPDSIKNNIQGYLCEQIAAVYSSETIPASILKSAEYSSLAFKYYKNYGDIDNAERTILNLLGNLLYHDNQVKSMYVDSLTHEYSLKMYCKALQKWLNEYDIRPSNSNAINYYGAYCIGVICKNYGRLNTSINYFIEAFCHAIRHKNYNFIRASISNISSIYGQINEVEKSEQYIELLSFFEPEWKSISVFNKSMQKVDTYRSIGKYETALQLINKVQFDTTLLNSFSPPDINKKYQQIYWIKTSILYALKNDSAHIYENYTHWNQEYYQNQFSQILMRESNSIREWLDRQGNRELSIREDLIKIKEENNRILLNKNILLDSLAKKNKKIGEDERHSRIKDSIYYNDTLAKSNRIRELENQKNTKEKETIQLKNEKRLAKRNFWYSGIISTLIVSFFAFGYRNKKNKERNRLRHKYEIERINNLTRNNIHNYQNDYSVLGNLISEGDLAKLEEYEQYYGEYLRLSYGNWKAGKKISLSNELETGENYFLAKKTRYPDIELNISSGISWYDKALFLQSVFDTVFHNSITHGFKNIDYIGQITINIDRNSQYLFCNIFDNGIPPLSSDLFFKEKERGLSLLKVRIENLYFELNRKLPENYFSVNILPEDKGTIVKLILPYEEI